MADVVLFFSKSSFLEKAMKHQYPPLSLLNSAVYLDKEYDVKIIDQRVDSAWEKHLVSEVKKNPLCVGFTSFTGEQINYALSATKLVKANSDSPVVWGGVHPTILPKQTLENKNIDYVVRGEGEQTFLELVKGIEKKKVMSEVKGIFYKDNGRIKQNDSRQPIDLNTLPDLPYHLLDMKKYLVRFRGKKMMAMESSRGCVNRCAFCFIQNLESQKKWRALTAEKTVGRVKEVVDRFGVEGVEFQDYNFFVDINRARKFAEQAVKEKLDIFWNTCARVTDVIKMDDSYLRTLEKSGLTRLALGVESGSDRLLKLMKKDITIDQVLDVSKKLSTSNINPVYSMMCGFPTETEKELKKTVQLSLRLIKENKSAKISIIHCYRPLPGNELFNLCLEHGLKAPTSLEEWGKYEMTLADYPWISSRRRKMLNAINFLSLFVDRKYEEVDSKAVGLFARLYNPLATYRLNHFNFNLMFEPLLKKLYVSLSN